MTYGDRYLYIYTTTSGHNTQAHSGAPGRCHIHGACKKKKKNTHVHRYSFSGPENQDLIRS